MNSELSIVSIQYFNATTVNSELETGTSTVFQLNATELETLNPEP